MGRSQTKTWSRNGQIVMCEFEGCGKPALVQKRYCTVAHQPIQFTHCQKRGCQKKAARNQKYCCRDHSPYGNLAGEEKERKTPPPGKRALRYPQAP